MKLRTVVLFAPIVTSSAAELKGKLHFYWREDVMKFEIKAPLKKIQTTFQRDGMFMSSDQGLKALKAKTGMKGPLLGKKMVSFRF